jgi:hypothetical protein
MTVEGFKGLLAIGEPQPGKGIANLIDRVVLERDLTCQIELTGSLAGIAVKSGVPRGIPS